MRLSISRTPHPVWTCVLRFRGPGRAEDGPGADRGGDQARDRGRPDGRAAHRDHQGRLRFRAELADDPGGRGPMPEAGRRGHPAASVRADHAGRPGLRGGRVGRAGHGRPDREVRRNRVADQAPGDRACRSLHRACRNRRRADRVHGTRRRPSRDQVLGRRPSQVGRVDPAGSGDRRPRAGAVFAARTAGHPAPDRCLAPAARGPGRAVRRLVFAVRAAALPLCGPGRARPAAATRPESAGRPCSRPAWPRRPEHSPAHGRRARRPGLRPALASAGRDPQPDSAPGPNPGHRIQAASGPPAARLPGPLPSR